MPAFHNCKNNKTIDKNSFFICFFAVGLFFNTIKLSISNGKIQ